MANGVFVITPNTPVKASIEGKSQLRATVPQKRKVPAKAAPSIVHHVPAKSSFVANLAGLASKQRVTTTKTVEATRSVAFAQRAPPPALRGDLEDDAEVASKPRTRDDSLAIVEDLQMGPYEHRPPADDPQFNGLEPHSRIRLLSRAMSHDEFSDMLRGRYYISVSTIYSVVRPQPGRTGFDVPVDGDWVTIGVVAEHGPIRMTVSHQSTVDDDAGPAKRKPVDDKAKGNDKAKRKPTGKKFVNFKLVDFGTREASAANAQIRGDAMLSLLLFESDSHSVQVEAGTGKKTTIYRGGSRGAFEAQGRLREGTVVAVLNPRILKPMQSTAPHRTQNVLAITPESAESIVVLGQSKDLGMCIARRKDGKPCGSWFDKRSSEACDYHVQRAVQSKRASRPEFTAGTSGMKTFAGVAQAAKQPAFDPARKWGLKPEAKQGSETYVVAGHTISSRAPALEFTHEKIGRERDARQARKRADDSLTLLLDRDVEQDDPSASMVRKALKVLGRYKPAEVSAEKKKEDDAAQEEQERLARKVFSADKVKALGFDPLLLASKAKAKPLDDAEAARQVAKLTANCASRHIDLGRRPGEKVRSGIVKPVAAPSAEDDDDLEIEPPSTSKQVDVSDDDLEIAPPAQDASDDDLEIDGPRRPTKMRKLSALEGDGTHLAFGDDDGPLDFPDSDEDMA